MRTFTIFITLLTICSCNSSDSVSEKNEVEPWYDEQIIDLTHTFDSTAIYWPTEDGFVMEGNEGMTDAGFFYEANRFFSAEHGGTHLDAPVHFSAGKQSVEEIPLKRLIGQAVVIDVSEKCRENADYQITPEDIQAWEKDFGRLKNGTILLFRTGFGQKWPDRMSYLGTEETGPEAVPMLHFPGIHPDAAKWLVGNRTISAVGIDTPSIDYGQSELFETHQILYAENIPGFENVANLSKLPEKGFIIIALPMKIGSGSGAPLRIIAVMNQ